MSQWLSDKNVEKEKHEGEGGEKKNPLSEIDVQLMSQLLSLEIR